MRPWSDLPIARRIELRDALTAAQIAAYKVVWNQGGTDAEAFAAAQLIPRSVTQEEFFSSYAQMVRDDSPAYRAAVEKRRRRALRLSAAQRA